MKIIPTHLIELASRVLPFDTEENRADYKARGLTDKQYRWFLCYSQPLNNPDGANRFIYDVLFDYLDDSHVDTAVKHIIKPL